MLSATAPKMMAAARGWRFAAPADEAGVEEPDDDDRFAFVDGVEVLCPDAAAGEVGVPHTAAPVAGFLARFRLDFGFAAGFTAGAGAGAGGAGGAGTDPAGAVGPANGAGAGGYGGAAG